MTTQWIVRSEHTLYADKWLDLRLADVELPDGRHLDHRLIRMASASGTVMLDEPGHNVLLLWRHRFITDCWGWEIPIGGIDAGEEPAEAALREAEEEAGWRPKSLAPLLVTHPSGGIMNTTHHLFVSRGATRIGEPEDSFESERIEWVPLSEIRNLVAKGDIQAGTTLNGLLYVLSDPSMPSPSR